MAEFGRLCNKTLYTEKNALVAAHKLNEKVLPWFDAQKVSVLRILTDRGTEYCGRIGSHAYLLVHEINKDQKQLYSKEYIT